MSDVGDATERSRPARQLAEPARFWIAAAPRTWRLCTTPYTDIAAARVGGFGRKSVDGSVPELDVSDFDDLLYLPPVDPEHAADRDRLAEQLTDAGISVLLQLRPEETTAAAEAHVVIDLLPPLLAGDLGALAKLPAGSTAVWPLIPGLTDPPELWEEGCEYLAHAGVRCVQPLVLELTSQHRRRLAEGRDDDVFDALFHGRQPSERAFSVTAADCGIETFFGRPATGGTRRRRNNRRIAAHLALAAEIWLRLGKSVGTGQGLFRAARGAEASHHDLEALTREGNLKVMDWLDLQSLGLVEDVVESGRSEELDAWLDEYLEGALSKRAADGSSA